MLNLGPHASFIVAAYAVTFTVVAALIAATIADDRKQRRLLADLERDKQPILITQHGLPSAYLVDCETYDLQQKRLGILEGIARGEMAIAEGRTVEHSEVSARLSRWLG